MDFYSKEEIENLPTFCGVYVFKIKDDVVYIGKAANIKKRVKDHFQRPSYKDDLFIDKVDEIGFIRTESEIEALILESELIKKQKPKYNLLWKDDKNYFFVAIIKQKCPQVVITHQKDKKADYIGPFVDGKALKQTLKTLRKIFPYYTVKEHQDKPCPWCHLNLCPGPNPDLKKYKKDLLKLKSVLRGKKGTVLKKLKKEMKEYSEKQQYERAAEIRDQLFSLERILAHSKIFTEKRISWRKTEKELKNLFSKKIERIEAYDISNIQGKNATGSMVVFEKGKPEKNSYRKFKIKMEQKPNDTAMIKEVLKRRISHKEWKKPDLILIDGGKGQLSAAKSVIKNIPVVALAKKKNEIFFDKKRFLLENLSQEIYNLMLYLRDEAHRFAITYHRKLREIDLRGNT